MAVTVVDSSAILAIVLAEQGADAVASRLEGKRLIAPTLLGYEIANVLALKTRRLPDGEATRAGAFRVWRRMDVDLRDVPHEQVAALSVRTGLTSYDASYLWLSIELRAVLVTLDRQLARVSALHRRFGADGLLAIRDDLPHISAA